MALTTTDLKKAFREVMSEEFAHIPTDESSITFTFSDHFNKRMEKLIKSQSKVSCSFINTAYKHVAAIFLVLITTAVTICSIKPLRDPTFDFLENLNNSLNQSFFVDNTPDTPPSNPNSVTPDSPSSTPNGNHDKVKYCLIYAKEFTSYGQNVGIPSKDDDLVDGYLKEVVAKFEGQDVYFRVMAMPVAVKEELADGNDTPEKNKEIIKSRIDYIKKIGAMDVTEGNNYFTFYITVNAEMINKIGEAGGYYLYLAAVSRPDGYDIKIPDSVAYSLENIKDGERVKIKVGMNCPKGAESVNELFAELKIGDEQISDKYYGADFANFTGYFTKDQIIALAEDKNVMWIYNVIDIYEGTGEDEKISEDNLEVIKMTEGTKTP